MDDQADGEQVLVFRPLQRTCFMHLLHLFDFACYSGLFRAIQGYSSRHIWFHVQRKLRSHHFSHGRSKVPGLDRLEFGVLTNALLYGKVLMELDFYTGQQCYGLSSRVPKAIGRNQHSVQGRRTFLKREQDYFTDGCFGLLSFLKFVWVDR